MAEDGGGGLIAKRMSSSRVINQRIKRRTWKRAGLPSEGSIVFFFVFFKILCEEKSSVVNEHLMKDLSDYPQIPLADTAATLGHKF